MTTTKTVFTTCNGEIRYMVIKDTVGWSVFSEYLTDKRNWYANATEVTELPTKEIALRVAECLCDTYNWGYDTRHDEIKEKFRDAKDKMYEIMFE